MSTTMKFLFLFVVCFVLAAYADDKVVEVGNLKYNPQNVNAKNGDVIVFTWLSDGSQHDVVQSDSDGSCTASTKITNAIKTDYKSSGTWNYTIKESPGSKIYYFCSYASHCKNGMYGSITVVSDDDTPSTATTPGATPSGTPSTPSGGSDSTPSSTPSSAVSFNSITAVTLLVFVSSMIVAASLL